MISTPKMSSSGTRRGGAHEMQCLEVWGGSVAAESGVSVPGVDAWVYSEPFAGEAQGGDIHYVSMCGAGRVARFILADVAGHGGAVSDLAVKLRRLMRRNIGTPDQTRFARTLNRAFSRLSKDGVFATAVMTSYFAPTDQLIVCLAGHPRPLWFSAAENRWRLLSHKTVGDAHGGRDIPLGIIPTTVYHQFAVTLHRGDLVILYSDALIEAGQKHGYPIEEEGLLHIASTLDPSDPSAFGRALIDAVDVASGGSLATRADDLTVLLLHHNGSKPAPVSLTHKMRMMLKMMGI